MSLPDYMVIHHDPTPPPIPGFPHRLILRPIGPATTRYCQSAAFLLEPGCASEALNDPALDGYLKAGIPVLVYARRTRDLRPVLRRGESFLGRGYVVEVLA